MCAGCCLWVFVLIFSQHRDVSHRSPQDHADQSLPQTDRHAHSQIASADESDCELKLPSRRSIPSRGTLSTVDVPVVKSTQHYARAHTHTHDQSERSHTQDAVSDTHIQTSDQPHSARQDNLPDEFTDTPSSEHNHTYTHSDTHSKIPAQIPPNSPGQIFDHSVLSHIHTHANERSLSPHRVHAVACGPNTHTHMQTQARTHNEPHSPESVEEKLRVPIDSDTHQHTQKAHTPVQHSLLSTLSAEFERNGIDDGHIHTQTHTHAHINTPQSAALHSRANIHTHAQAITRFTTGDTQVVCASTGETYPSAPHTHAYTHTHTMTAANNTVRSKAAPSNTHIHANSYTHTYTHTTRFTRPYSGRSELKPLGTCHTRTRTHTQDKTRPVRLCHLQELIDQ